MCSLNWHAFNTCDRMKNSNEKWWHYIKESPPYLGKNCKSTISKIIWTVVEMGWIPLCLSIYLQLPRYIMIDKSSFVH